MASEESITWVLKPTARNDDVRERLATIAQNIDAATVAQDAAALQRLAGEAHELFAEAFLDPLVPQLLTSHSFDDVVGSDDRLATSVQLALANIAPIERGSNTGAERMLHYRTIRHLRGGGMGNVTLAWDEHLDRHVVIKRALKEHEELALRRLEREARASAKVRHANIVRIYALEYLGDVPLLIEEYVEGVDLAARIGNVAVDDAIFIAAQIADGLRCAHERGIIHRDLKPQNVRLRPDGTPVILDFGLGKAFLASPEDATQLDLTAEGTMLGTPSYMAPEQLQGREITTATDVFAFGVLFYEILTAHRPFTGATQPALFAAILEKEPPPIITAEVPPAVVELVFTCLRKEATQRPHMGDVAQQLIRHRAPSRTQGIVPQRASIIKNLEQDDVWVTSHRDIAHNALGDKAVIFECDFSFIAPKPHLSIGGMRDLLRQIQCEGTGIGMVSDDERYSLRRGSDDVFATILQTDERVHWAARTDGTFFYAADVPLLDHDLLPIEPLLGETFRALQYLGGYASAIGADDAKITLAIKIHRAEEHLIAASDWSHPFAASLDTLQKRARGPVHSTLATTTRFLVEELQPAVRFLFDDLMTYFDFLTIPSPYYTHAFKLLLSSADSSAERARDLNLT